MTDLRKAAEIALGVLLDPKTRADEVAEAVKALRQALAQEDNHESLRLATKDYIQELEDRIDEYILKEEQQEPVAWMGVDSWGVVNKFRTNQFGGAIPLYTAPLKKEWVGLDEVEVTGMTCECVDDGTFNMDCAHDFARAIEESLRRRNT